MAEKKLKGEPGDTVELADKTTGFTDPETGFDISRDQRVELGETVGERTQQAILSGGLLIVTGKGLLGSGKGKKAAETTEE